MLMQATDEAVPSPQQLTPAGHSAIDRADPSGAGGPPHRDHRPVHVGCTQRPAGGAGRPRADHRRVARTLGAAARTVTLVVLDPETGHPIGIGEQTYRPRQLLRDQALTMAGTCTFPSCRQPAWRCQLDHTDPFDHQDPAAGGSTCLCNIKPRCVTHHLFRTHGGWSAVANRDGTVTLTSPTGHEYHERSRQFTLPGEWLDHHRSEPARRYEGQPRGG